MVPGRFAYSFLLLGALCVSSAAEELPLPAGVINVARPEFGDRIGAGSDYGLANVAPLEVGPRAGEGQAIYVVRTRRELRLSPGKAARFQVRLGNVTSIYFWLEAPPAYKDWNLSLSVVHADGYKEPILGKPLRVDGINFVYVPPGSVVEFQISSRKKALPLNDHFTFTVSPVLFSLWPNSLPVPNKSLWD